VLAEHPGVSDRVAAVCTVAEPDLNALKMLKRRAKTLKEPLRERQHRLPHSTEAPAKSPSPHGHVRAEADSNRLSKRALVLFPWVEVSA
jgi:hypothetical protein